MKNAHRLTEGAILLAVFAVLLGLTLYVPVLGAVVNFFLSLPFIIFAAKNKRKESAVFLIASLLLSLIVGTLLALPLTLAYGLTGIVIGDFIRREKGKGSALIAGTITFLFNLILQYGISIFFFNINFIEESIYILRESIDQTVNLMNRLGQTPNEDMLNQFYGAVDMLQLLIPSLFVMASLLVVFMIQLVSYPIIKRFGIEVYIGQPFRQFTLPKSLLLYFLLSFLCYWIFQPESGSYLSLALSNIMFIIQLLMILQGVSVIWFFSHLKNWPKVIPILFTIFVFILPILLYLVWFLGIMDVGFDLRKKYIK